MRVRSLIQAGVAGAVVTAAFSLGGAARAESCVTLPGTTGATIEVGGQEIRVPATSGVAACIEPGGLPGLPRVDTGGGTVSIVLGAGSSTDGYVAVRYTLDGNSDEIRVPIPGGGGGSETCLASVGEVVREDCLVEVSVDDIPTPPPTPTVPPPPTLPPTPEPDPFCHRSTCIPYGGSILQEPYDELQATIDRLVAELEAEIEDFLRDPCNYVSPSTSCW
ncbi:MAG TPA: hypothetical protein VHJ76_02795 [Actinomycetota bacterium]|nr:hypothetical protein [Actinomycetota bacterium]